MKKKGPPGPFEALRPMKKALEDEEARKGSTGGSARPAGDRARGREGAEARPAEPKSSDADDEALLLARMFAGVTPLSGAQGRVPTSRTIAEPPRDRDRARRTADEAMREDDAVHARLRALVDEGVRFEVADDGVHVEGRRVDLSADTLRKLRRGSFPIDGRLDMHGMTVSQARSQLEIFLRTMRTRGERCVLVIHGKGDHSPLGLGVLRGEIAAWLSQSTASEHVAAFATARDDDGGSGAVYVLLRN